MGQGGDLAEEAGAGLADAGGEGAGGEDDDGAAEGDAVDDEGERGGLGGVGAAVGEGEAGGVGPVGADGEGGELADEGGLCGGVGEDAGLAGVEADAVEGLEDDEAAGGGFAGDGGSDLPEGVPAVALGVGEGAPGAGDERQIGVDFLLARGRNSVGPLLGGGDGVGGVDEFQGVGHGTGSFVFGWAVCPLPVLLAGGLGFFRGSFRSL